MRVKGLNLISSTCIRMIEICVRHWICRFNSHRRKKSWKQKRTQLERVRNETALVDSIVYLAITHPRPENVTKVSWVSIQVLENVPNYLDRLFQVGERLKKWANNFPTNPHSPPLLTASFALKRFEYCSSLSLFFSNSWWRPILQRFYRS